MPLGDCGLNSASSNRRIAYIQKEDLDCPGKLYPTRAQRITKVSRQTSSDFSMEKTTVRSSELRADRQISATLGTAAKSAGTLEQEFSAGSMDDGIAAFLGTEWTTDNSFNTQRGEFVSFANATSLEIDGVDLSEEYTAGDTVKTEGFKVSSNNRYWTITGASFAGGKTTLTVAGATAEAGNVYGTVLSANDLLFSGTTVATVSGDFSFPANALDALIAAGKLVRGRKVMIQGLGIGSGSLALTGLPVDGESVTINKIKFEFDNNSVVGIGSVPVTIGATADATADNLATAIQEALGEKRLYVSAAAVTGTVTMRAIRNDKGVNLMTTTGVTNGTLTNFAGADATAEGLFTIVSATGNTLSVSPKPQNDIAAGATVVVKGSHASPPSNPSAILKQTFRVEDAYTDIDKYMSYHNQSVGGIELGVTAEELITGSTEYVGAEVEALTATEIGDTVTNVVFDALTSPLYNSTTNVTSIKQDGTIMASAAMSFSLSMKTDVKQLSAIGSYFPVGTNPGSLDITGELELYFDDTAIFQKFFDNAHIAIEFVLEDVDGNSYVIGIPKAFLAQDTIENGSLDDNVMEKVEWTGDLDAVSGATIIFSRFSSATPHQN